METVIYFIRHAQSRPSSQIHHADWPLSELGAQQAKQLAEVIRHLNIVHLISSPYRRCIDTIKPFIDTFEVPMNIHENLRERYASDTFVDNFYELWCKSWKILHLECLAVKVLTKPNLGL